MSFYELPADFDAWLTGNYGEDYDYLVDYFSGRADEEEEPDDFNERRWDDGEDSQSGV